MKVLKCWRETSQITNNCSTPKNFESSNGSRLTEEMLSPLFCEQGCLRGWLQCLNSLPQCSYQESCGFNRHQIKSLAYQLGIDQVPFNLGKDWWFPRNTMFYTSRQSHAESAWLAPEENAGFLNQPTQAGDERMVTSTDIYIICFLVPRICFKVQCPHCKVYLQRHRCGC
jgi:hypothetical protein